MQWQNNPWPIHLQKLGHEDIIERNETHNFERQLIVATTLIKCHLVVYGTGMNVILMNVILSKVGFHQKWEFQRIIAADKIQISATCLINTKE